MKTPKLIAAWLFVGLCLGWGVLKSAQKSLPLFTQGMKGMAKPN
jgi:hypothetical protein